MKTESVNHCGIKIHHVHGYIKRDFWCESYHSHKHAEIFVHISGKMNLFIENNVYKYVVITLIFILSPLILVSGVLKKKYQDKKADLKVSQIE